MGRTKEIEESEEEVEETKPKKNTRKAPAKKAQPKKPAAKKPAAKKKKDEAELDEEDEISEEISVEEEDTFPESDPTDKVAISKKTVIKKTDPNARLKDLTPLEIIQYLIDKGEADLNPSLKRGGIAYKNLLLDKRGRHRNARRRNNNKRFNGPNQNYPQAQQGYGGYDNRMGPVPNGYSRGRQQPRAPYQLRENGGRNRNQAPRNSRQPFQAAPQDKNDDDLYETDE